jgi:hypothetical protein
MSFTESPIDERAFGDSDETLPCLSEPDDSTDQQRHLPGSQTDLDDSGVRCLSFHQNRTSLSKFCQPHTVDLTGKVQKIDPHPFYQSREADFFKGQWIREDGEAVMVSVTFSGLHGNLTVSSCVFRLLSRLFDQLCQVRNLRLCRRRYFCCFRRGFNPTCSRCKASFFERERFGRA